MKYLRRHENCHDEGKERMKRGNSHQTQNSISTTNYPGPSMAQGNLQDKQKVNKMIEVLKILAMQFESV